MSAVAGRRTVSVEVEVTHIQGPPCSDEAVARGVAGAMTAALADPAAPVRVSVHGVGNAVPTWFEVGPVRAA